jgi:hypothetical protein
MTRPRRSLLLLAVAGVLGACSGDDSSPAGAGGSSAAGGTGGDGGAGGAGGSSETGGAGGATSGGAAGDGGSAGSGGSSGGAGGASGTGGASGSGGAGGNPDSGTGGKGGNGPGDASTGGPPLIDGGRCVAPGTYTVVNQGSDGYIIAGSTLNPMLTLCRGMTYTFAINAPGHPFFFRREAGDYEDGITGNRTAIGNVVFTVSMTAPDLLFYECSAHPWMTAPVHVVN